ncbi:MAG: DUF2634 domain-containing protein [Candidatus Gastranaerophilales bacterium]|nr:DUF2634 domain-containing protein [Candidatus Gastranaerophilales bacterium]
MSFNFIPVTLDDETNADELPIFYELARDLDTLEILVKNGEFYTVSKNEALKIWILKALHKQTSRYEYRAYSNNYGNEILKLFGRHLKDSLLKSELKRYIEEALFVNPYIKKIENYTFLKEGSKVTLTFTVTSIYGEFEQTIQI